MCAKAVCGAVSPRLQYANHVFKLNIKAMILVLYYLMMLYNLTQVVCDGSEGYPIGDN